MTKRNIKQLRRELKTWGSYWASKEYGAGYSNRSSFDRMVEQIKLGCHIKIDKHLYSHHSDMIIVPEHIKELDKQIERLRPECIRVIRVRYILNLKGVMAAKIAQMEKRTFEYWLQRAELVLV
ncbi:hypothetical protein [Algicola sagamiensis]|uniref:hypothetical protein n=1 Tax=Algicola sagamiensis TaxID=163869 RepID=UPI001FE06630|nr:hypothetical protein [Algicola sagamiensis]